VNYKPEKIVRSGEKDLLVVRKTNLVTAGDRALSVVAPKEWNKLPHHIKNAKTLSALRHQLKLIFLWRCMMTDSLTKKRTMKDDSLLIAISI
jgi:hypothetical protein